MVAKRWADDLRLRTVGILSQGLWAVSVGDGNSVWERRWMVEAGRGWEQFEPPRRVFLPRCDRGH